MVRCIRLSVISVCVLVSACDLSKCVSVVLSVFVFFCVCYKKVSLVLSCLRRRIVSVFRSVIVK